MTTWLPAICGMIIVFCTVAVMMDPAFNSNSPHINANDRLVGAAIGFAGGLGIAAVFYVAVRLTVWLIAWMGGV